MVKHQKHPQCPLMCFSPFCFIGPATFVHPSYQYEISDKGNHKP